MKTSELRALIIGYGSIGKRHAKNLITLGVNDVSVYDPLAKEFDPGVKVLLSFPTIESFDVCLVCTPNDQHLKSLQSASLCSKSFFIEKPVSIRHEDRSSFVSAVGQKPIMVGCNYRFDSALQLFKKNIEDNKIGRLLFFKSEFGHFLPSWRPLQDYRMGYAAKKETGGGVILDRIHELDYLKWIFGGMLCKTALIKKVSDLQIETEDLAMINLVTFDGIPGTLHLDYLQPVYHCQLRAIGTLGVLEWGFKPSFLKFTDHQGKVNFIQEAAESDVNEMYLKQLKYFLGSIQKNNKPMNGLEEAFETLELIDHIKGKVNA